MTGSARVLGSPVEGLPSLLCLPGAGGGASVFAPWRRWLPHWCVRAVEYPDLPVSVQALAHVVASVITADESRTLQLVVLGHSFGAHVAWEAVRLLPESLRPSTLIVSSAVAPTSSRDLMRARTLEERADQCGLEPQVLESLARETQWGERYERHVAALQDYCGPERARDEVVAQRVVAIRGDADRWVSRNEVLGWGELAAEGFVLREVPGSHAWITKEAVVRDHVGALLAEKYS